MRKRISHSLGKGDRLLSALLRPTSLAALEMRVTLREESERRPGGLVLVGSDRARFIGRGQGAVALPEGPEAKGRRAVPRNACLIWP